MSHDVLMFGWEYPPKHLGGLGVACEGLVRGLLHHDAHVTLVLPHAGETSDKNVTIVSPHAHQLKSVAVPSLLMGYDTQESYLQRITQHMQSPTDDIELYGKDLGEAVHAFTELAVELSKDTHPDVIHSHDWMTFGAGARAAAYHHKPFVAQIHATELDRTHFRPNEWIYHQERNGLMKADHIIAVSGYTRDILVSEYGISRDKIEVVHNGTDDVVHHDLLTTVKKRHPLVLFVGRLTVQKGPFHFLEAARMIHRHMPDARFVIAGDGYLLSELVDRAIQYGLEEHIIFAGKLNGSEVRELYKHADCFVMPSTSEPFGLVALEAMAHGAPVIVSKQSGVREVIPNSFQIDFWDVDKLADCIATVLRDEHLALQLKSEAPRTLQKLRWEHQAGKVISLYQNLSTKF